MCAPTTLDAIVKHKMRSWPQHPPGLDDQDTSRRGAWLRGRPGRANEVDDPFLKFPGSNRMRTIPDGLWLCFGGSERDAFVDIFVIEVCGSLSNLLDKRGRFTPSMHSLLAVCPVPWLLGQISPANSLERWRHVGLLHDRPKTPLTLPVRDIRVMYALRPRHYEGFASSQVPHAHEFFAPVTALMGPEGCQHPPLRAFIARALGRANFWEFAGASAA